MNSNTHHPHQLTMHIVQVLVHSLHVVGRVDGARGGAYGRGQHEAGWSEHLTQILITRPSGIDVHLVQVLDEEDEVLSVLGLTATLARVLPVQVQAVKLVSADEGKGGASKGLPGGRISRHLGILLTTLIPAPDGQSHLT